MTDKSIFDATPPPQKDDKLFAADRDWQTNACISQWDTGYAYSSGYRTAAFSLAEKVCETHRDQDRLVYPIVYLYRHHIELVLKSLIALASTLLDRPLTNQELGSLGQHKLDELWKNLKPLLEPACKLVQDESFPDSDIEGIESYIGQLHEHDPDGQRFRYATYKEGKKKSKVEKRSLKEDLRHINIRMLANNMEKLADYLENVESWFSHLLDTKHDVERSSF